MKSLLTCFTLAIFSHVAMAAETRTATLDVNGMTCAVCPLTVKAALKKQPGVSEVNIDLKSHIAEVKFDPTKIRPAQLATAVTDAGFPATVKK